MPNDWYKDAIFYEVHVKAFSDAAGPRINKLLFSRAYRCAEPAWRSHCSWPLSVAD